MTYTKTKQIKNAYEMWKTSNCLTLNDCYKKPSSNKFQAFVYCKSLMKKHNGHDLKITSYNLYHFSVGFIGEIDGKEAFFYITPSDNKYIFLEDLK